MLPLAQVGDERIGADAGGLQERAPVRTPDIHPAACCAWQRREGAAPTSGQAQLAREVVTGTGWKHRQRRTGTEQAGGGLAGRTIAADGDYHVIAAARRVARDRGRMVRG